MITVLTALLATASAGDVDQMLVGVHVGPSFPLTALDATALPQLEVGYVLPAASYAFDVFATGSFSAPAATGTGTDPRVPGGTFAWELHEREIGIGAGLGYGIGDIDARVRPELAVGPQLVLLHSTLDGNAGAAQFPTATESQVTVGVAGYAGVGVLAGPGRIVARLGVGYAPMKQFVTGKSSTLALSPTLGYRFQF
jgi:hypothetical protein